MLLLLEVWFAGSEEAVHVPAARLTNLRHPSAFLACNAGSLAVSLDKPCDAVRC